MGTFLQKTARDFSKCYMKSPMASSIVSSTQAPPSLPSWHKIQKADGGNLNIHRTTNLLWYERNNHVLIVSSGDDENK